MPGPASRRWLLPLVVIMLGAAVRLAPLPKVFTDDGVVLRGDTDPHYHVLRAERLLAGAEGAPWRDPWLGWPDGADIPWPPLYDAVIAWLARLPPGTVDRERIAGTGAILVVLIGLLALPLTAWLGRRLTGNRTAGWLAAALVAVMPAGVQFTEAGRADQHGAELLFFTAILLVFVRAVQEEGSERRDGLLLGLLFALAFWTWPGSALLLAVPAGATALGFVAAPAGDPRARRAAATLAVGGAAGAILLVISIGALGAAGALTSGALYPLSGLHAAMAAGVGALAALLLAADRWPALVSSWPRRLGVAAAAVALPAAASLGPLPWLREGVATGLTALVAGNPWYASVGEFEPLFFSGRIPLSAELQGTLGILGLTIPLALLAAPPLVARLRTVESRFEAGLLALLLVTFLGLTLARIRFAGYATVPLALCDAMGLAWLSERLGSGGVPARALQRAVMLGGFALAAVPSLPVPADTWSLPPEAAAALRWLAKDPVRPGREGVLSQWSLGHAVQYFADRPVVASPFGTEGGQRSMERWTRFWYARDAAAAEEVLAEARVGWVALGDPAAETLNTLGLAPPGTPAPLTVSRNAQGEEHRELTLAGVQLVPLRLHQLDGRGLPGVPPLDGFQLRYESPAFHFAGAAAPDQIKIFALVPGARLSVTGLRPGETVWASSTVTTNQGRTFVYATSAGAGAAGTAELRLPYGTGLNGAVEAGPWSLSMGAVRLDVEVPPAAVLEGSGGTVARPRG